MIIIALLIGVSLSIALLFLAIFYWNIKSGQYDDTYSPSVRILFEDKPKSEEETKNEEQTKNEERRMKNEE